MVSVFVNPGFPEAQTQRKGPNHNQNTYDILYVTLFEINMIVGHYIRSREKLLIGTHFHNQRNRFLCCVFIDSGGVTA
jgi:hypothetical protein